MLRRFGRYPFHDASRTDVIQLIENFEIGPTEGAVMPQQGVSVLALIKGQERFVFLYDDESADQLLQTLGQYAADPELNFSWYDAATLSQRVRKLREADATSTAGPKNRIRRSAA